MNQNASIGIDIATENARIALLSSDGQILFRKSRSLDPVHSEPNGGLTQNSQSWVKSVRKLLNELLDWASKNRVSPKAAVISATSGTFVIVDENYNPLARAVMYNDRRGDNPLARAAQVIASIQTSKGDLRLLHTPEFVIAQLLGISPSKIPTDWSHALKTGFNLRTKSWQEEAVRESSRLNLQLPEVVSPGTAMGRFNAASWGLGDITFYAGMTDGCTGQISAGGVALGNLVTTLGTTLVLKVASNRIIEGKGFYSHLVNDSLWLAGAASNLGGDSLHKFGDRLTQLEREGAEREFSSVISYPLRRSGERFPIPNSGLSALWSGRPRDEVDEYLAILEGVAFAERYSYETLNKEGAETGGEYFSVGGATKSPLWNQIRANTMGRELKIVRESGSDIGAAMIAHAAISEEQIELELSLFKPKVDNHIESYSPDLSLSERYEERYECFKSLIHPYVVMSHE